MLLFHRSKDIEGYLKTRNAACSIGFVPTMGALHKGHISLIEASKKNNDITVSSIFVNPTQFNDPKDFEKYPITIAQDLQALFNAGCTIVYLPGINDIYKTGTTNLETYELGYLETLLEGYYRPGHYQGVCQVVSRLLQAVQPHNLYLGQKDYQQCMVITKLVELLKIKTRVEIVATMREENGLAMSSRNMRLSEDERQKASCIYQTLLDIKNLVKVGLLEPVTAFAKEKLIKNGLRPEYVSIANRDTLLEVSNWNGTEPLVALIAAYMGDVRLIDNMVLQAL